MGLDLVKWPSPENASTYIDLVRSISKNSHSSSEMDPLNFFKGYNQLKNVEDQAAAPSSHCRRKKLLAVSFIVFLTLIIGAVAAVAVLNYPYAQSPSLSHSNADASIKAVCNVTEYPASCFAALSSTLKGSSKFDPEHILVASLKISLARLSNLSSLPETLILRAEDPRSEGALRDCGDLLEDASDEVNKTISSMAVAMAAGEETLTESKIQDMRTWLSSAITDQETCLDGLKEMNSRLVDEVKNEMQPSREFISISLAILSNIKV